MVKDHNLSNTNYYTQSTMVDKIRQLFLSIIGIVAFGFVFYLVFKDNPHFMIGFLGLVVGIILIVLLITLIGRIRDNRVEKKRRKPFNPKLSDIPPNKKP